MHIWHRKMCATQSTCFAARDKLQADLDVMVDQTRTIDNMRITNEPLTTLTDREVTEVEEYLKIVLGLGN